MKTLKLAVIFALALGGIAYVANILGIGTSAKVELAQSGSAGGISRPYPDGVGMGNSKIASMYGDGTAVGSKKVP